MNPLAANDVQMARAELYERAGDVEPVNEYRRLQGIDWSTIEAFAGCMALVPVRFYPGARFDYADQDGQAAVVIEAFEEDGATVTDLVAWPVAEPRKAASMFGRVPIVGHWQAVNPATYLFDKPLLVHRTPLNWLKAGGNGCAVVNSSLAARVLLDTPGRIAAEDAQHAREIARLLENIVDLSRIVAPVGKAA